jgi:membrane-associated phospholipid phosphatase
MMAVISQPAPPAARATDEERHESRIWEAAAVGCKGMGALAYPLLAPLSWGQYEWTSWSRDPRQCYGMLAEGAMAAIAFGVSLAEPRGSPVFGAGSFDRFFRDELRSHTETDNFFDGTMGSTYAPFFLSAAALLAAAGVAGNDAYQDTLTRALPLLWLSVVGNSLATQVFKKSFGRERPYLRFENQRALDAFGRGNESRESFYSGHASTAFLSAAFMDPVIADVVRTTEPRYALARDSPWTLWLLRLGQSAALYGLATAVAYSRIEIDKHYMTDVLAGAAVGTLHGHLLYRWGYRGEPRRLRPAVSAIPGGLALRWSF